MTNEALTADVAVMPVREPEHVKQTSGWRQTSNGITFIVYLSCNLNPQYSSQRFIVESARAPRTVVAYDNTVQAKEKVIVIKHVYRITGDSVLRETLQLAQADDLTNEQRRVLDQLRLIADKPAFERHMRYEITAEYRYTYEEIKKQGGAIYSIETDFLITLDCCTRKVRHPYIRRHEDAVYGKPESTPALPGFQLRMEINDLHNKHGPRFLVVNQKIYALPTCRDPTRPPGVYLTRNQSAPIPEDAPALERLEALPLEDYDTQMEQPDSPLPYLFKSLEAAQAAVDISGHKLQMREMENEGLRMRERNQKFEAELAASQNEIEVAQHRCRELELKMQESDQKHAIEMQSLARKDRYESISYARKDSHESFKFSTDMVKYVPILIIGLGAAYVAIRTVYSKG